MERYILLILLILLIGFLTFTSCDTGDVSDALSPILLGETYGIEFQINGVTSITKNSATVQIEILNRGEYGNFNGRLYYDTNQNFDTNNKLTPDVTYIKNGKYDISLSNLTANTTYYVKLRVYADSHLNSLHRFFSNTVSFTTLK